jgi:hypothetical protein
MMLRKYVHVRGTGFDDTTWELTDNPIGAKLSIAVEEAATTQDIEDAFHRAVCPLNVETSSDGGCTWTAHPNPSPKGDWQSARILAAALLEFEPRFNVARIRAAAGGEELARFGLPDSPVRLDREFICTHEAGHAVVHYSFGHPMDFIEVGEDKGYVRLVPLTDPTAWGAETVTDERAEQEVMGLLAGPLATEMLLGRGHGPGERGDYLAVSNVCRQRGWDEMATRTSFDARTRDLIRAWEPSIRALASELIRVGNGRLPAARMTEVIDSASGMPTVPQNWGKLATKTPSPPG